MATDVMRDRNYLLALIRRGPRDPLAQAAEKQWELLNQQEAQGAQLGATRENLMEQISAREEAHGENIAQREQAAKQLADYREDLLAQRGEEAKDREAARVLAALQYETDPKVTKQVLSQFYASHGITSPGAAPTDPVTAAAQRFRAAQGGTVAPGTQPPTATPTATPVPAAPPATPTTTPPVPTTPPAPTGVPPVAGVPAPPPAEEEFMRPAGTVGYISGRPAGEVIAEGALRTGVMPQSESGRAALASKLSTEGLPFFSKSTTTTPNAPVAAATKPVAGGGLSLSDIFNRGAVRTGFEKPATPTPAPVFAPSSLAQGPTPEPTPSGTPTLGPFSGAVPGPITQGPLPTPAGTPPAVPPPGPPIDEEMRKRLAQQPRY